ncbi:Spc98 family-domain-containing protein [Dimargaris cristalligena]|uniref:Spindle pole body component n=1 Tax=Dimargaris cristalligena TaxID=215637 RepID=A0A4P9ZZE8_9FUNG|nr:Spc98 family-domain-containing protein [Dimargaris cristalligena]|eukprot:RKP39154.1 Spc98 family-domain-containing protein [Dimargaris cristalligena]
MPDRDDSVSAAIAAATPAPPDLGTLSPLIQQQLIIDDLLYVASGGPGRYLQLKNADPDTAPLYQQRASAWRVDTRLDRSLRAMVKSLLPACTYYLIIRDFVVEYNHFRAGRVNQALCAAMDEIIQEFHTLIAQLEHLHRSGTESEPFTLQKLTFYLQPSLTMLERLAVLICIIKRQTEQNFLATRQSDYRDYCQEILTHPREGDAGPTVEPGKSSLGRRTTAPLVCRGGRTLKVLAGEMLTRCGDPNAKRLYGFLLSRAAKPFLAMLQMWLRRGEVHDPCEEFMIRPRDRLTMVDVGMGELGLGGGGGDHRGLDTNGLGASSPDGWSTGASYSQYVICLDMTPGFLRPFSKKILLSGMYLNIIRACKTIGHQHQSNDVSATFEGQIYVLQIENAYQYANRTLLWILTEQNHLLNCLRAMKHYFFLDQSDFLTHFLDLAHGELRKPTQEVPLIKLQSLMDVVLQNSASVGAADPYREDVKVDLSCHRFMDQVQLVLGGGGGSTAMPTTTTVSTGTLAQRPDQGTPFGTAQPLTCLEALTLDFVVTFPVSLVITPVFVTKYQMIFRHLLQLKHTEHVLSQMWLGTRNPPRHRSLAKKGAANPWQVPQSHQRIWFLRNCMLNSVRQIIYYTCWEVLEAHWTYFEAKLVSATTIDELTFAHTMFLDNCLQQCMLTVPKLMKIIARLLAKCQAFAVFASHFMRSETASPLAATSNTTSTTAATTVVATPPSEHSVNDNGLMLSPTLRALQTISGSLNHTSPPSSSGHPSSQLATGGGLLGAAASDQFNHRAQQEQTLAKMEKSYQQTLELLLDALRHYSDTETPLFLNLVTKLNLNNYYSTGADL